MLAPEILISILPPDTERIFIAYSGGVDSHVLLHLSCSIAQIKSKITAVYVDHGLQVEAVQWPEHCEAVALALDVEFLCLRVNSQKDMGQSQEEVARDARYHALRTLLGENDVLMLAQHREDQLETVLLQLFRGAGVQGLSGMPLSIAFGPGLMCRPFLDIPKQAIDDYAKDNGLIWVEDPSNESIEFDRNFLRNQILPKLKQRWPALDKTVARSARHCANSHHLTQGLAKELLNLLYDKADQTLNITQLLELDANKQQLVIRFWFANQQLRMPSVKMLHRIVNEVANAKACATPEVQGKGYSIRRYREKLYCLKTSVVNTVGSEINWPANLKQLDLGNGQALAFFEASEGISIRLWQNSEVSVRYRTGAEKIKLPGRTGHHTLKKLFQETAIPPWERSNLPLIYLNGVLAAVADLWISADFYSVKKEEGYQIVRLNLE